MMTAAAHADPDPRGVPDPCPPGCGVLRSADPSRITVHGTIWNRDTGERVAGALVVFVGRDGVDEETTTDARGIYTIALEPGTYERTVYSDVTLATPSVEIGAYNAAYLAPIDISGIEALRRAADRPLPDLPPWRLREGLRTWFGFELDAATLVVTRDRTHRGWLAALPGIDPRRAQTTVGGAARFAGAPGIPLAFVDELVGRALRLPITSAAGAGGGADVELRRGTNQAHGLARVVLGRDARAEATGGAASLGSAELLASGPLARDHAWLSAGLVTTRGPGATLDTHGMLALDGAVDHAHRLQLTGLGSALGDGTRDAWGDARWVSKLRHDTLELRARITGERLARTTPGVTLAPEAGLAPGEVVDRAGGAASVRVHARGRGLHELVLAVEAGTGERGAARHEDATLAAGDTWQLRHDMTLEAGVRGLVRYFDGTRAHLVAPRAAAVWDPTEEGRARVFVAYQRVARLDDGLPGDWRDGGPRSHDEVALAAALEPRWLDGRLSFGAAARARWGLDDDTDAGVDAWIAWIAERTFVHVGGSTLDEVLAAQARRVLRASRHHTLQAAGTLRVGSDRGEGGASLIWQRVGVADLTDVTPYGPELGWELAAEGYTGTDGPGARLLLGATW